VDDDPTAESEGILLAVKPFDRPESEFWTVLESVLRYWDGAALSRFENDRRSGITPGYPEIVCCR